MAAGAGIADPRDSIVLAELLLAQQSLARALEAFMTRRVERWPQVVEILSSWENGKGTECPGTDPVGAKGLTFRTLAQPF